MEGPTWVSVSKMRCPFFATTGGPPRLSSAAHTTTSGAHNVYTVSDHRKKRLLREMGSGGAAAGLRPAHACQLELATSGDVLARQTLGALGIARGDGVDDPLVLLDRRLAAAWQRYRRRAYAARPVL